MHTTSVPVSGRAAGYFVSQSFTQAAALLQALTHVENTKQSFVRSHATLSRRHFFSVHVLHGVGTTSAAHCAGQRCARQA